MLQNDKGNELLKRKISFEKRDLRVIDRVDEELFHLIESCPLIPSSLKNLEAIMLGFPRRDKYMNLSSSSILQFYGCVPNLDKVFFSENNPEFFLYFSDSTLEKCFIILNSSPKETPLDIVFWDIAPILDENLPIWTIKRYDARETKLHTKNYEQ